MIEQFPEIADAGFLREIGITMVVTTLVIGVMLIGSLPPRAGNLVVEEASVLPKSVTFQQLSPPTHIRGEP